jgi:hypothetical protein
MWLYSFCISLPSSSRSVYDLPCELGPFKAIGGLAKMAGQVIHESHIFVQLIVNEPTDTDFKHSIRAP